MENQRLKQLFLFLEQSAQDSFTLYSIAYEYLQMGALSEAKNYFERLLSFHPDYLGAYYQLGRCLRLMGLDKEAIAMYQIGIEKAKEKKQQHTLSELQNALMNAEIGEEP